MKFFTKASFGIFVFVCFLLAIVLQNSCTKLDVTSVHHHHNNRESFFKLPANTAAIVKRVAAEMERINAKEEYVHRFIKANGYPLWSKATFSATPGNTQIFARGASGDSLVVIPIENENGDAINNFIVANVGDSVVLNLYRGEDYDEYSFGEVGLDSINAHKAALQIMLLNYRAYGTTNFILNDYRLFVTGTPNPAATHRWAKITSLTSGNIAGRVTIIACIDFQSGVCTCPEQNPNTCECFCDDCRSKICITYIPGGGGDENTPDLPGIPFPGDIGGGGGEETGTPYPCPSLQGRVTAPIPCTGGGNPPVTPMPPLIINDPTTPPDPCEVAQQAAKKLDTLYSAAKIDSVLSTIPDLATETNEKGFAGFRKFSINPQNPLDTTFLNVYKTSGISTGTDSAISIDYTLPYLHKVVFFNHTHTASAYSAQSAADIFNVIKDKTEEPYLMGNFVAAADGSKYSLTITDPALANQFYAKKDLYLDGDKWKRDSAIGKAFNVAIKFFSEKYKGNANQENLAYEMAMATVLSQFKAGVTLNKKDASGNFKPIVVIPVYLPFRTSIKFYFQDCL